MHVLYLCHRHLDLEIGGLAEFLHYLPLALKSFNIKSLIYTQAENKNTKHLLGPRILENQASCYSGPFLKPAFFPDKKLLQPLMQLCREQHIDLIHAQGTYRASFMAMHVNKQLGIPYIVTSHSDILAVNSARLRRRSIRYRCRKALQHSAQVTHLTPLMIHASSQLCNTDEKNIVIGNGIDFSVWQTYQETPEQNYMLAIGRLEPEKGFHVLIEAYARLKNQRTNTALVIAGTGSAEQALKIQATHLGLHIASEFTNNPLPGTIVFTGYVKKTAKMQLVAAAKIILFAPQSATWEEAFGIVQLEAMAAGKVLIASDIPQTRYLQTHGLQAALVAADNVAEWAEQMQRFIEAPDLCQTWGGLNRLAAVQFDWKTIAEQYGALYRKVLTP